MSRSLHMLINVMLIKKSVTVNFQIDSERRKLEYVTEE